MLKVDIKANVSRERPMTGVSVKKSITKCNRKRLIGGK